MTMGAYAGLIAQGAKDSAQFLRDNMNKGVQPGQKFAQEFSLDMYKRQLEDQKMLEETQYQRKVNSAINSGLHPLFAMGTSGNTFSPAHVVGGSSSGSWGQAPDTGALERSINAMGSSKHQKMLERNAILRAGVALERDQVELMKAQSELKAMNAPGQGPWPPGIGNGGGGVSNQESVTRKSAVPLGKRPVTSGSRKSLPLWTEATGPHGRSRVLNQELGMDELSQILWAAERLRDSMSALNPFGHGGIGRKTRVRREMPAVIY